MRYSSFAIALALLVGALLGALLAYQEITGITFAGALAFGGVVFALVARLEVR